ncbi:hypothetical protein OEZ86_007010 [Tetradesmus obliquus]|nr:hypothetical protein OEZ86_007010 [Tetradesmus obliquus]
MAGVMDKDHVLVRTPSRSYTVGQQQELLRDMGADMMANHLDKVQAHTRQLVEGGPVPGIQSFCVYSTAVRTPMTLTFASDIPKWRPLTQPAGITWGTGDGTVDLRALRICSRVVQAGNIEEVAHPMVDHIGLNREPAGLAALDKVYAKAGMVKL